MLDSHSDEARGQGVTGRIQRSCQVCGRTTEDGSSRCAKHKSGGLRPRRCVICGALTTGANYCPAHTLTEEERRRKRQTWRTGYRDPEYARNRARRYVHAHGRCEDCGRPLKGHLFPDGARWECDHLVALSDGGSNAEDNLRCRCLACHYPKTAKDRRARGQDT